METVFDIGRGEGGVGLFILRRCLFGLLVMSALSFKAWVDPWLECFAVCVRFLKFTCECDTSFFTARVRSTYDGRLCFHRCVSVQLSGWGVPHPRSGWGGGYPISGLDDGGVPYPRSGWWQGYPIPGLDGGGTPSQVWMEGTPWPGLYDGGYPGTPPPTMTGWGTPPPPPEQHSEHLLRGKTFLFTLNFTNNMNTNKRCETYRENELINLPG